MQADPQTPDHESCHTDAWHVNCFEKSLALSQLRVVSSLSMNIKKFKGNPRYFSARDLKPTTLKVEAVEIRKFNEQDRVVAMFEGEERELRLTPHQVAVMSRAFGDDTDNWTGATVHIKASAGKGIELSVDKPQTAAQ